MKLKDLIESISRKEGFDKYIGINKVFRSAPSNTDLDEVKLHNEEEIEKLFNASKMDTGKRAGILRIVKGLRNYIASEGLHPTKHVRPKRLYISGPITGYIGLNMKSFKEVGDYFAANGFQVVNPYHMETGMSRKIQKMFGQDPKGSPELIKKTWSEFMTNDIDFMLTCSGFAMLPGWGKSTGAVTEMAIGIELMNYKLGNEIKEWQEWLGYPRGRIGRRKALIATEIERDRMKVDRKASFHSFDDKKS